MIEKQILKATSLSEEVASFLRRQALDPGIYPQGSFIREEKLASELNISRGPIREALKILDGEGLVKIIPRKGAVVVDFSVAEIEELWHIRYLLEKSVYEALIHDRLFSANDFSYLLNILKRVDQVICNGEMENDIIEEVNELNIKFHIYIAKISKKEYTTKILDDVYKKLRQAMMRATPSRMEDFVEKHTELLVNLQKGELDALVENSFYSYFERRRSKDTVENSSDQK